MGAQRRSPQKEEQRHNLLEVHHKQVAAQEYQDNRGKELKEEDLPQEDRILQLKGARQDIHHSLVDRHQKELHKTPQAQQEPQVHQ